VTVGGLLGIFPCRLILGGGNSWGSSSTYPRIATWIRKNVQGARCHPLDCYPRWNIGVATSKLEELASERSSQVVDDTPLVRVCPLVVEVRRT
jgi:hypothetical protein